MHHDRTSFGEDNPNRFRSTFQVSIYFPLEVFGCVCGRDDFDREFGRSLENSADTGQPILAHDAYVRGKSITTAYQHSDLYQR